MSKPEYDQYGHGRNRKTILRTIFPTGRKTVALSACAWNADVAVGAEDRGWCGVLVPGYPDLRLSASLVCGIRVPTRS
jgi:hypothetical protein